MVARSRASVIWVSDCSTTCCVERHSWATAAKLWAAAPLHVLCRSSSWVIIPATSPWMTPQLCRARAAAASTSALSTSNRVIAVSLRRPRPVAWLPGPTLGAGQPGRGPEERSWGLLGLGRVLCGRAVAPSLGPGPAAQLVLGVALDARRCRARLVLRLRARAGRTLGGRGTGRGRRGRGVRGPSGERSEERRVGEGGGARRAVGECRRAVAAAGD